MTFQIKHARPNIFSRNFFKILTVLAVILILVLVFGISDSGRSLVSDIFSPFLKGGNYFYEIIGTVPKFFSDKNKLIAENQNLSDEVEKNRIDSVDYESLKYENQKLREALSMKPAGNSIAATIISRSPQIPLDSLFLDKGTADGLHDGDLVLAGERILIGKIAEATKNESTVALNSFAGADSYGFVDRTSEPLDAKGAGGGSMQTTLPIDFDIAVGDKLMVPGSVTYTAAVVGVINEDRSSGFKNVLMSLPVDVSKIGVVFISPVTSQ